MGRRTDEELSNFTNILSMNGKLDPWSAGSVTHSVSEQFQAIYMDDSAHHLDLRSPSD